MKTGYVKLLGEKHPLCFSLSATEEIVERFGGTGQMTDALTSADTAQKLRAVDTVLEILMRAGRAYCAAVGEALPKPLPCRPADVIGIDEANEVVSRIFDTITADASRQIEADPPKESAGPAQA